MSVSTRARSDQYHHASTIDLESVDAGPAAVTDILGPPAAVPPAQLVDQTDLQRRMDGHSRFSPQVAKDMPVGKPDAACGGVAELRRSHRHIIHGKKGRVREDT